MCHFIVIQTIHQQWRMNMIGKPYRLRADASDQILLKANSERVFDVRKYGAKRGIDISQALMKAWKDAIASTTPSKILIPKGHWTLSQAHMEGPNKAPINLAVRGTLQAYRNPAQLPVKSQEWVTINYVNHLTISGGGVLDGHGQQAWKMNNCNTNKNCVKLPINLSLNFINDSIIQDITTKDSKNFHVNCISSRNVTFQRFTVSAPGNSLNTDGIHIARGNHIRVLDSIIKTGDDCVSMGDDLNDVLIRNVQCGPGHGISIGSLGKNAQEKNIKGITVQGCTFTGTQNGVRIKTWPSAPATLTVSDLHFLDLTMVNAGNPIVFDQKYCPWNQCDLRRPSLIKISNVEIKNIRGTSTTPDVLSFMCSKAKPCDNIRIGLIDLKYNGNKAITICENIRPIFSARQTPRVC
ncbi:exopolygalacturonase-like [Salvia splendens]|uniref:exopolygalacturonase-like n=1 Tax=Salvia splendens TaxID=180675 RepID=UPI001C252442|nr:exopolygalacturonase-like [Salvia splendens]